MSEQPVSIGWREWLILPDLGIPAIKAKIDTGARTSALHAFRIESFKKNAEEWVHFWIHPLQKRTDVEIMCEAKVVDKRTVKDSGGHAEERFVIKTLAHLGPHSWPIEITLTSREDMLFRMLLGRTALSDGKFAIAPDASYLLGRNLRHAYKSVRRKQEKINS